MSSFWHRLLPGLCLAPFLVLATLNSGGYRYGASDQAFYIPAVLKALDPVLFPRDGAVLEAQTRLTAVDEVLALVVRFGGVPVHWAFALLYVVALLVLAVGTWQIGQRLYRSRWTVIALLAALTLRHGIARSGTNTLEGYFHPRTLAFGLGAIALAAFLRGRLEWTALALAIGALVHPTTALWFGLWLMAAIAVERPPLRKWIIGACALGAAAGLWALTAGPLAGRLAPMDDEWRQLLASRNYLFPFEWPAYAWIVNLAYIPIIVFVAYRRHGIGLMGTRERAVVIGSAALLAAFAAGLIGHALNVAIAFQLQPARTFWMLDYLAVIYVVWLLGEGFTSTQRAGNAHSRIAKAPALTASVLIAASLARGVYVLYEAERPPVQIALPDDDWGRTMAWVRATETDSHFLADPWHAVEYGSSLRVAGERDVFVEAVKDASIGMYDRAIAIRTDERLRAIGDFGRLAAHDALRLAQAHDLDYLITTETLDLPIAFESGSLYVYRLQ